MNYDYKALGSQGYTGTVNDRVFKYLGDQGYTGSLNDRKYKYLGDNGFTGSLRDRLKQAADLAGYSSVHNYVYDLGEVAGNTPISMFENNEVGFWYDPSDVKFTRNLLTYPQDFNNAVWTVGGGSVTANTSVDPTGESTADTLTATAGQTSINLVSTNINAVKNKEYVVSVYLKDVSTRGFGRVQLNAYSGSSIIAYLDFSDGSVTTATGGNGSVTSATSINVGNGWYRLILVGVPDTVNATTGVQFSIWMAQSSVSAVLSPAADGTEEILVWGAQLEEGSTVTKYQNTTVQALQEEFGRITLFQDSAGTSAVTGVEQPVGLMLDKSGNGNNATQATSASRPTLSARYNLLEQTEAFDDAAWVKSAAQSVTANDTTDPIGGSTADLVVPSIGGGFVELYQNDDAKAGTSYTGSFYLKNGGLRYAQIVSPGAVFGTYYVNYDLDTGTVSASSQSTATNWSFDIQDAGNGWYKCSVTTDALSNSTGGARFAVNFIKTGTTARGVDEGAFNGTDGLYVWGASYVESQYDSLPYQRVGDASTIASDYDSSVVFPKYLRFDGTDDYMVVNGLSASSGPIIAHFGYVTDDGETVAQNLLDVQTGATTLAASVTGAIGSIGWNDGVDTGSAIIDTEALTVATFNLSNAADTIRVNGIVAVSGTTYDEAALGGTVHLGASITPGTYLDGNLYQAILRNTTSTDAEIDRAEAYINRKMTGDLL